MKENKGLLVNIFKPYYGPCDNGNFSSKLDSVVLIASSHFPFIPKIFSVTKKHPAVMIYSKQDYLVAYPVNDEGFVDKNCSFGGTFIYSSDSRFPCTYPIPLHDRKE